MSLLYWLQKFSQEAMLIELFLIGIISASYFGYLLMKKRKYGAAKQNIPDNVVRAYLMELISQAEGFKNQLFGENFKIQPGQGPSFQLQQMAPSIPAGLSAETADTGALRAQLAAAMAKQQELSQTIAMLSKEKSGLEGKLTSASAAAASGAQDTKQLADLKDKIQKLESRLAEYEVIEDDLANLKKYQQENKQLRAKLAALTGQNAADIQLEPAVNVKAEPVKAAEPAVKAEPVVAAPAPEAPKAPEPPKPAEPAVAAAPAPAAPAAPAASKEASPIASAEESVNKNKEAESFEQLVGKVEESLAAPAGASVVDPAAAVAAAQPKPAENIDAAAAALGAAAAPAGEKSDADLLSEFERMLNS